MSPTTKIFAAGLAWSVFAYTVVRTVWALGPLVEEAYFPVLRAIDTTVERHGSQIGFTITIAKLRACKVVRFGYQVEAMTGGIAARTTIVVKNATGQLPSPGPATTVYPPGIALLGPFTATLPMTDAYDGPVKIWADVWYACHPLWPVHAVFGPVEVPTA